MSKLEQKRPAAEEIEENACFSRTMGDIKRTVEACLKKQLVYKVVANYEKEIRMLNSERADELSIIRFDLAEKFENLRKEFTDSFVGLSKLVEQYACQRAGGSNSGDCVMEPQLATKGIEMNQLVTNVMADENSVAAIRHSIVSDVDTTLIRHLERAHQKYTYYEQTLRDRDQVVDGLQKELKSNNESLAIKNEELNRLGELLANRESEMKNLTALVESQNKELCYTRTSHDAKDEEVSNLKYLLKLANEKLEERLEQVKQLVKVASSVERLSELITVVKVNETRQTDEMLTVTENLMSSLTEMKDCIEHVANIRKTDQEPVVINAETPVIAAHLTRLQQLYPAMTEKLSAKPVAAVLFQNDLLSLPELEKVQCSQTPTDAAVFLLRHLLGVRSKDRYDCFLRALKETNQGHIFLWLTRDDFEIDSQHAGWIRQKYTFLLDQVEPVESGLTTHLLQGGVIDVREKQLLETNEGSVCQVESLLAVLSRKSMENFELFLVALDETGQGHVAEELRRCQPFESSVSENVMPFEDLKRNEGTSKPVYMNIIAASGEEGRETADVDTMDGSGPSSRSTTAVSESSSATARAGTTRRIGDRWTMVEAVARRTRRHNDDVSTTSTIATTITLAITASDDRRGPVAGLTVCGNELFIVRWEHKSRIEVYNATDCTFQRNIPLEELGCDSIVWGLTSCDTNNCLYVSDGYYVIRVKLLDNNAVIKWKVSDGNEPRGLSVNGQRHVVVACSGWTSHKLIEYTEHGTVVREILLQDGVVLPWHAIQLVSGQFLVSVGDSLQRVCLIDANGRVLHSYCYNVSGSTQSGQTTQSSRQFAVDRNDGCIFLAGKNNRIDVLDGRLKWSRDLTICDGRVNKRWYTSLFRKVPWSDGDGPSAGVNKPFALYLDEQRSQLFVGEWNGVNSRVVVVKV